MTTYIIRRLIQAVAVLFLLSLLFFLLVRLQATSCQSLGCTELLKLDQPVATQYVSWMGSILSGNLGYSGTGVPIGAEISQRLPATIILVGFSLIIQQLIALPLGMLAAVRQFSVFDQSLTLLSYVLLSLPAFVLGITLIYVIVASFGWLAAAHSVAGTLPLLGSPGWFSALAHDPPFVLGDLMRHLTLPASALIATGIAVDSRFMRAAMLQVLHQDYIRTARAKGVSSRVIIFKHALRNAILPVVTNFGLYVTSLIGGVVVVETVFSWGGVGQLFADSLRGQLGGEDYPTLQALLMLSAVTVLLANLLADLAYAWLDPRIRYEE
ncbi:MAG TPA: ABC transporter permease [Chloroflexota bacterium]|nr:ABC transporter permease [Chloroflexota bacterium]